MKGKYRDMLDCALVTTDIIAISKKILKEYKGRAYTSKLILQSFLLQLQHKGKLKYFKQSLVNARVRRYKNSRSVKYPPHKKDKKWIEVAIAVEARYIISTNEHLLKTAPNRFNNDLVETIEPCRYIEIRCPD